MYDKFVLRSLEEGIIRGYSWLLKTNLSYMIKTLLLCNLKTSDDSIPQPHHTDHPATPVSGTLQQTACILHSYQVMLAFHVQFK